MSDRALEKNVVSKKLGPKSSEANFKRYLFTILTVMELF